MCDLIWIWFEILWFDLKSFQIANFLHNTMLLQVIDQRQRPCFFHCFVLTPLSFSNSTLILPITNWYNCVFIQLNNIRCRIVTLWVFDIMEDEKLTLWWNSFVIWFDLDLKWFWFDLFVIWFLIWGFYLNHFCQWFVIWTCDLICDLPITGWYVCCWFEPIRWNTFHVLWLLTVGRCWKSSLLGCLVRTFHPYLIHHLSTFMLHSTHPRHRLTWLCSISNTSTTSAKQSASRHGDGML